MVVGGGGGTTSLDPFLVFSCITKVLIRQGMNTPTTDTITKSTFIIDSCNAYVLNSYSHFDEKFTSAPICALYTYVYARNN